MKTRFVFSLLIIVGLSACSSVEKTYPCPQVAIIRSLERAQDYGLDAAEDSRLVGSAVMQKISGRCDYEKEGVEVKFNLMMQAEKGPRLGGEKLSFPYFVSLLSPENAVLGKEMMMAEFLFKDEAKSTVIDQPLRVVVPLSEGADGSNHRILLGFQLTESQIKALQINETATSTTKKPSK